MKEITTQNIIDHLLQMEKNNSYLQGEVERQEKHIDELKKMIMKVEWINPDTLELSRDIYSRSEIEQAFLQTKVYEGLKTNEFDTVLDTFIEFLEGRKTGPITH